MTRPDGKTPLHGNKAYSLNAVAQPLPAELPTQVPSEIAPTFRQESAVIRE
jgi:hypothetical protein